MQQNAKQTESSSQWRVVPIQGMEPHWLNNLLVVVYVFVVYISLRDGRC
jgi:hypothetical protein